MPSCNAALPDRGRTCTDSLSAKDRRILNHEPRCCSAETSSNRDQDKRGMTYTCLPLLPRPSLLPTPVVIRPSLSNDKSSTLAIPSTALPASLWACRRRIIGHRPDEPGPRFSPLSTPFHSSNSSDSWFLPSRLLPPEPAVPPCSVRFLMRRRAAGAGVVRTSSKT